ncbi:MAG: hypothetical protein K6E93_06540 [Bacteroidales bacterium]|nr:hypothetical protein [Bacteroidales bacterium]
MKRTVKVLAIALLGMTLTVACNNNAEPVEEDTIIDTIVEEPVVEEPVVEEPVVEEPVKKAPVKTTKKEAPKNEVQVDASKMTISNSNGTGVTISKDGGAKATTAKTEAKVDASKMSVNTTAGSATVSAGSVAIKKN